MRHVEVRYGEAGLVGSGGVSCGELRHVKASQGRLGKQRGGK